MDGDLGMIYLLRDNETLASDRQLARDHDLVKRTHTMGILVTTAACGTSAPRRCS
jgi:hypothetical protein